MILEEATYEAYGYYPSDLSHGSHKKILAVCDGCGKPRIIRKDSYHALCRSCCQKGVKKPLFTEEAKRNMSKAQIGKTLTAETKRKLSKAHKGRTGEYSNRWKGGMKLANRRRHAKHKQLGFMPLNAPLEGAEGHHVTHNNVVYIPHFLHHSIAHNIWTAKNMEAVNALAIDFLLNGF